MQFDMITMSAVDITVTTVLGLVLVFTWLRERGLRPVGWWGLIMLLQAAGVVLASYAAFLNDGAFVTFGLALMALANSLKWTAPRDFVNRSTSPAWALLGPASFPVFAYSGYVDSLLDRFIAFCALVRSLPPSCPAPTPPRRSSWRRPCAALLPARPRSGLAVGATVSVGVATDIIVDTDLAGLFRRADAALCVAKRAGRDQVVLLESDDDSILPRAGSTVCTSPTRVGPSPGAIPKQPARIT
jgi:hypothetical protein